jgi:hypothetical protein
MPNVLDDLSTQGSHPGCGLTRYVVLMVSRSYASLHSVRGSNAAALTGNPLYPLARTGPLVPAHSGDDQERGLAERELLEDALCPAWPLAMLLRARRS